MSGHRRSQTVPAGLVLVAAVLLHGDRPAPPTADDVAAVPSPDSAPPSTRRLAALLARARSVPRFVTAAPPPRFPGFPAHTPATPALLYEAEARDPRWAPAM